jgi:hypothetical protein
VLQANRWSTTLPATGFSASDRPGYAVRAALRVQLQASSVQLRPFTGRVRVRNAVFERKMEMTRACRRFQAENQVLVENATLKKFQEI